MFRLDTQKGFCQCVGDHILHGTVDEFDGAFFNAEADVMVPDVYVFGMCVIASIFSERDC
jgi:hypothetical protein